MNAFLIAGVILVAILVIWLAWQSLRGREKSGAVESQMNELRRDLQTIATLQARSTGQLETIAKGVGQRLDSVAPALQDAIKNSAQITGQMTSDAQTKMASCKAGATLSRRCATPLAIISNCPVLRA